MMAFVLVATMVPEAALLKFLFLFLVDNAMLDDQMISYGLAAGFGKLSTIKPAKILETTKYIYIYIYIYIYNCTIIVILSFLFYS